MIALPIVSILLAALGTAVFFGTLRNMRRDTWAVRARDRFFGRYFRWCWLGAGLVSSYLLVSAAWLVWVHPIRAVLHVLLVPVVGGGLVFSARKVLPWLYDRKLRR